MDNLITALQKGGDASAPYTTIELVYAFTLALICTLIIATVYRWTHKGIGYSQSYVHSLVLTSLVTTVIMIVIGSNIARAFSLVGALSIIRFRNAIKETKDVGYIFFAMGVAMACGTRFYGIAIVATLGICAVMILLGVFNFGAPKDDPERLLRVQVPAGTDLEAILEPVLRSLFTAFSIVMLENARHGLQTEVLYSVRPRPDIKPSQVIEEISKVNDGLKVAYNYAMHNDEV